MELKLNLVDKKKIVIFVGVLFILELVVFFVSGIKDRLFIRAGFVFLLCIPLFDALSFLSERIKEEKMLQKGCLLSSTIIALTYLPIMNQPFMCHDDYTIFNGEYGNWFGRTSAQGRPIAGLSWDLFNKLLYSDTVVMRVISVAEMIIFSAFVLVTVYELKHNIYPAVILSIMTSVIIPVSDVLSYGCMYIFPMAYVISAMSVKHLFHGFRIEGRERVLEIALAIFYMVVANSIYQVAGMMCFPVILLYFLYEKKENKVDAYMPLFSSAAIAFADGLYFVWSKLLVFVAGMKLLGRGATVSGIYQILEKLIWFITQVIPFCIKNLSMTLLGAKLGGQQFFLVWGILIFLGCLIFELVTFGRRYGWIASLEIIMLIPLSYFVFLILMENGFTTYYIVALCEVVILIVFDCLSKAGKKLPINAKIAVIACAIFAMAFNTNCHINKNWIKKNDYRFEKLYQRLENDYAGEKRIHLVGCLDNGQVDIYGICATQVAMKDLGIYSDDVYITSADHEDYNSGIEINIYKKNLEKLDKETAEFMNRVYEEEKNFGYAYIKDENSLSDSDIVRLKDAMIQMDLIPDQNDEDVFYIVL